MEKLFMVIDASSTLDFNTLTKHRVPGAVKFLGLFLEFMHLMQELYLW